MRFLISAAFFAAPIVLLVKRWNTLEQHNINGVIIVFEVFYFWIMLGITLSANDYAERERDRWRRYWFLLAMTHLLLLVIFSSIYALRWAVKLAIRYWISPDHEILAELVYLISFGAIIYFGYQIGDNDAHPVKKYFKKKFKSRY